LIHVAADDGNELLRLHGLGENVEGMTGLASLFQQIDGGCLAGERKNLAMGRGFGHTRRPFEMYGEVIVYWLSASCHSNKAGLTCRPAN